MQERLVRTVDGYNTTAALLRLSVSALQERIDTLPNPIWLDSRSGILEWLALEIHGRRLAARTLEPARAGHRLTGPASSRSRRGASRSMRIMGSLPLRGRIAPNRAQSIDAEDSVYVAAFESEPYSRSGRGIKGERNGSARVGERRVFHP